MKNQEKQQYSASSERPSELRNFSPSSVRTSSSNSDPSSTSVYHPHPINFRKTSGIPKPNGELEFTFVWESSTGNLADLAGIIVGELVTYPSPSDPYIAPNPPFNDWQMTNPYTSGVEATDGTVLDQHSRRSGFSKPYRSANFTAKQKYGYKEIDGTVIFFDGYDDIDIKRSVDYYSDDKWRYKIEKMGISSVFVLDDSSNIITINELDCILSSIEKIGVGNSRSELMEFFLPMGGLIVPGKNETYWLKSWSKIKIDAKFDFVEKNSISPNDKITYISKIYI